MINWFEKNPLFSWIITILIAVIIFYMSSRQFPQATPTTNLLSFFYHFLAFFFFAFFLLISLVQGKPSKSLFITGIIISILYGISDEVHQYFVPGRYCCAEDILINSAGILTATILYSIYCIKENNLPEENIIF